MSMELNDMARERDALREENARLREPLTVRVSEVERERDALRARVEELEAGLRRVCHSIKSTMPAPSDPQRDRLLALIDALLSGGSQEPRPVPFQQDDTTLYSSAHEPRPGAGKPSNVNHLTPGAFVIRDQMHRRPRPDTDETCASVTAPPDCKVSREKS